MKLLLKSRVVHTVSGNTGEIYKFLGEWGVQVWNTDRGYERENWWWGSVTVRTPRRIKRYPRPFRWPRTEKTLVCHCKIGKMAVLTANTVGCQRCGYLVGDESFPRRIVRATEMLRKAAKSLFKIPKEVYKIARLIGKKPKRKVVRRAKAKSNSKKQVPKRKARYSQAKGKVKITKGKPKKKIYPEILPANPVSQSNAVSTDQSGSVAVTPIPGS